jgi:putative membrane protein insertion efficiency factor
VKHLLIWLLKAYRLVVSPLYGQVCRYYPSCSGYALRAVEVHGSVRGSYLAARRLLRCHPWARGGYDPVPGTPEFEEEQRDRVESAARLASTAAPATDAQCSRKLPGSPIPSAAP